MCDELKCRCGHSAKYLSDFLMHCMKCLHPRLKANIDSDDNSVSSGRLQIDLSASDDESDRESPQESPLDLSRWQDGSEIPGNHSYTGSEHSFDSLSAKSSYDGSREATNVNTISSIGSDTNLNDQEPKENKVNIENQMPMNDNGSTGGGGGGMEDGIALLNNTSTIPSNNIGEENSYFGVEVAPGYGEVNRTRKLNSYFLFY